MRAVEREKEQAIYEIAAALNLAREQGWKLVLEGEWPEHTEYQYTEFRAALDALNEVYRDWWEKFII